MVGAGGGGRSSFESLSERSIGVRKADRTSGGGQALRPFDKLRTGRLPPEADLMRLR